MFVFFSWYVMIFCSVFEVSNVDLNTMMNGAIACSEGACLDQTNQTTSQLPLRLKIAIWAPFG